jgi:hypothetical protein
MRFNFGEGWVDTTVKGYLKMLLKTVWIEGEGFSGKRPFGDSGWWEDLSDALIKVGVFESDPQGDPPVDYEDVILSCIDSL